MQNRGIALDEATLDAIRKTRRDLGTARHLPGFLYTAPEIFAYEVETIFMKEWLCIGRVEEFENEGDYRAMRIAGEPLLVCRDGAGTLNAFSNVCRHRGVEVASGEGKLQELPLPLSLLGLRPGGQTARRAARQGGRRLRLRVLHAAAGQARHLGRLHLREFRPRQPEPRRLSG